MNAMSLFQHCVLGEIVHVHEEGQDPLTAQTMDLSDTFMRIRSQEPLNLGSSIQVGLHFLKPDATTENLEIPGTVLNHFREPESDQWQVGIRLCFENEVQERNVLGYLSSCQGLF